jgi:serine/threonine-protein kinase
MGLVYRAYDTVIRREVAVKTILDIPDPASLQLFYKECDVLASMSHPNIVEIFDIGEFEEEGKKKPYFVMPLLPGTTLENFIRNASHRLTVERIVEIMSQTCRGLQAAHERGLVHRDLKPSNIFVMEDDSVKIIDFGVAHMTDAHSTRGQKGTLLYMSPEQIEMKPLMAVSDVFSLSVVCYEALTGRHPFQRARADEVVEAILRQIPPPASEVNPAVSQAISRVVHKGMAKQPWHRFSSAKDFGETLNKALRNEPIEIFDPSRTRPRLERAAKALESGDYQFAGEILGELEAEGHIDSAIGSLRQQLDSAVRRKTVAQLLDAAKARFEEEEDPLALQKLQEVLQMEPDNATALSLKEKIENRRSERQIDNWYRLARQHVDNHAYPHAREALQNVLQLRPKETRALQLIADIDRQEQEYNKLRQEKAQLHRAAMEAWQKGDVSSALTKLAVVLELDRKAPDASNAELGATYQNFYNQVRSEHDAMNTAYAEARKQLAEHNFGKAQTLCETYLAKYPNNALFQALQYDVEEQQRQELSAYIASVDRRVEAEPDLEKRVSILREALGLYPGETHFERALRLVQDKRDLVNSIVARAHLHEEQAAFSDALNDWEILRTIYSQYPGLKFEIDRLQKRREQQARIEAKTRLIEQIDSCRHSGDFARALELLERAAEEFPNDPELRELEKLANEGVQRKEKAQKLMTDGQDLCGQHQFAEGIKLLRQAYELEENNPLTRAVLSNALVEQAHLVVESNWHEAEDLARQALDLNPGHPMAKTIRNLIQDQKRETAVNECLSQARKLQAAGDLAAALALVEAGLSSTPREPRLTQIHETLQRDLQAQRRQVRRRDLEELRRMEREAEATTDLSVKQAVADRAQALVSIYADDEEFLSVTNAVLERLNTVGVRVRAPGATKKAGGSGSPPEGADATLSFYPPPTAALPGPAVGQASSPPPVPPQPSARPPGPPFKLPPWVSELVVSLQRVAQNLPDVGQLKAAARSLNRKRVAAGGAVVFLILILAIVLRRHPAQVAPTPGALGAPIVRIHTSPSGATIRINNEVRGISDIQIDLPEGSYQVAAQLDGYEPASQTLEVKSGSTNSLDLALQPALPAIRLSSDTGAGEVSFDDQSPVELAGAQWTADKLATGEHKLKFVGPQGAASFSFSADAGAMPLIKGSIEAKGVLAVVVGNLGGKVHIYSSDSMAKVGLDGQAPVEVTNEGAEIPQVAPGTHQLALSARSDEYKMDIDLGPMPTLTAFLESGQNIGTLVIVTGQDKVKVALNGKLQANTPPGGVLRIPNLEPRNYVVHVSKNGFQDLPDQKVRVRKGEQAKLIFDLQPIPRFATLSIQSGTPGAAVFVDQAQVGTVQNDGSLTVAAINPGDHTVELRKDRFKSRPYKKHFVAGVNVPLTGADAVLEAATGELRVTFTPADATVTLAKPGEAPIKLSSGSTMSLPPGTYTLNARTADNLTRTATVEVVAGQPKTVDLPLAPSGMSKWDEPEGWKQEKGVFVHKGGDFVLYSSSPTTGTFTFSAALLKGHRLQWVLNYVGPNDYDLFQIDENYFYRVPVRGGQKGDEIKVLHKSDKKSFHTIQIAVNPNEIIHQTREGDIWVVLDKWNSPGNNPTVGKFGFYIPGSDQVALSNFSHYGDLNVR